jgi:hypothetical protein
MLGVLAAGTPCPLWRSRYGQILGRSMATMFVLIVETNRSLRSWAATAGLD